ncbi:MAG: hypothetical protein JF593_05065 [Novosphingobium sp.]|nr:hypothetical protein [Novosphingobium sp.]
MRGAGREGAEKIRPSSCEALPMIRLCC